MEIKEFETQLETLKNKVVELENKIAEIKRNENKKIPDVKDIPQVYDFDDYERTSECWRKVWFVNNKESKLTFVEMAKEGTKQGNLIFPTEEFAEMFREKAQLIADCLLFKWLYDREFVPNWSDENESKYYVVFNRADAKFEPDSVFYFEYVGTVFFSTQEIAEKCAEWLNYKYFGIYNPKV